MTHTHPRAHGILHHPERGLLRLATASDADVAATAAFYRGVRLDNPQRTVAQATETHAAGVQRLHDLTARILSLHDTVDALRRAPGSSPSAGARELRAARKLEAERDAAVREAREVHAWLRYLVECRGVAPPAPEVAP